MLEQTALAVGTEVKVLPALKSIVPPLPFRLAMVCAVLLKVSVPPLTARLAVGPHSDAGTSMIMPPADRVTLLEMSFCPSKVMVPPPVTTRLPEPLTTAPPPALAMFLMAPLKTVLEVPLMVKEIGRAHV